MAGRGGTIDIFHPSIVCCWGWKAWPTYQEDIDVSSDASAILQVGLIATQQQAEDGLLNILMPMDTGGQGATKVLKHILHRQKEQIYIIHHILLTTHITNWCCDAVAPSSMCNIRQQGELFSP